MAQTAEGRALTEAHRLQQLEIAARAEIVGRALWSGLAVSDLDATTPAWLSANVAATEQYQRESSRLAAAYISEYRGAELGTDDLPIIEAAPRRGETQSALLVAGPIRVKTLIGSGANPQEAHSAAVTKYVGIMRRQVLGGGRHTVDQTTRVDEVAIGWRRVTDGDPCAFCAMLAGRGPIYTSKAAAGSVFAGDGMHYHGYCGCTAEIVYGTWTPTEEEARYIEIYEDAADQVSAAGQSRKASNILPLMRANGNFRDSPKWRLT